MSQIAQTQNFPIIADAGAAKDVGIDATLFDHNDVHVHVPAGAQPKEGPSAGVSLLVAISAPTALAIRKAGERSRGAVLASDAFFPFRDNVDQAAGAGVTAIVQPGGSMRDAESIAACDENDMAMVFTGVRHFRH